MVRLTELYCLFCIDYVDLPGECSVTDCCAEELDAFAALVAVELLPEVGSQESGERFDGVLVRFACPLEPEVDSGFVCFRKVCSRSAFRDCA